MVAWSVWWVGDCDGDGDDGDVYDECDGDGVDGDGDGKFSLTPGAPDETPISKLPKTPKRTAGGSLPPRRPGSSNPEAWRGMSGLQRYREEEQERMEEVRNWMKRNEAARRAEEAAKPGAPVRRRPINRIAENADGDAEIEKEIADYDAAAKKRRLTEPQRKRKRALEKERDRRAENKRRKAAGERSLEQEAYDRPIEERKKRQERNDRERSLAAQAVSKYPTKAQLEDAVAVQDSVIEREVKKIQEELERLKKVRKSIRVENADMYNMANDYSFRSSDYDSPEDEKLAKQTDDYIKIAEERLKMVQALPRAKK